MASKKSKRRAEYGDFQTPPDLARRACALLQTRSPTPASIVEPTCGKGSFLLAAAERFPGAVKVVGQDINADYVRETRAGLRRLRPAVSAEVREADFFLTDWRCLIGGLPEPIMVVGNPPWVTNAELGTLGSGNVPTKSNFQNHRGLDAVTGKSNFDISEWMLIRLLDALDGRDATLAMLCKTVVARKTLLHAWKSDICLQRSEMYLFDAAEHFGASVDACLLVCRLSPSSRNHDCSVYDALRAESPQAVFGFRDEQLIADVDRYDRVRHLRGSGPFRWRSGVKHDCTKVMELRREAKRYRNGFDDLVALEDQYVYPMLKSSDLAKGVKESPKRWMLVTQRAVGDDTEAIREEAPQTWAYLLSHAGRLDQRSSSIYRNRPRFSVFGVGDYTFADWKVAISGFYSTMTFSVLGTYRRKPIVLDDTCYFLACRSEEEAALLKSLLDCDAARDFYAAFVFRDSKRPITASILGSLDLDALATEMGSAGRLRELHGPSDSPSQALLRQKALPFG